MDQLTVDDLPPIRESEKAEYLRDNSYPVSLNHVLQIISLYFKQYLDLSASGEKRSLVWAVTRYIRQR
jgi:hypothetical protein